MALYALYVLDVLYALYVLDVLYALYALYVLGVLSALDVLDVLGARDALHMLDVLDALDALDVKCGMRCIEGEVFTGAVANEEIGNPVREAPGFHREGGKLALHALYALYLSLIHI